MASKIPNGSESDNTRPRHSGIHGFVSPFQLRFTARALSALCVEPRNSQDPFGLGGSVGVAHMSQRLRLSRLCFKLYGARRPTLHTDAQLLCETRLATWRSDDGHGHGHALM